MKPNRMSDESEEREMAPQLNTELLDGRAYSLASNDLWLLSRAG
jgi:hypothetical protein